MSQAASRATQAKADNVNPVQVSLNGSRLDVLKVVYAPIENELRDVESILRSELQSKTPFVDQLLEHSWLLGGKRIRPVLLLLSAAHCGGISTSHLQMAASLELIHTATLVHDDVLDEASLRRNRVTANVEWGNKISVLLGDYLFTNAFHMATQAGSVEALQMLARASNRVCEGEMRQNAWQGNFDLSEENYLRMITEKTAELCGAGCRIGAFLSGAGSHRVQQFESYGRCLGVAFQIIDDILDIVGDPGRVGKTLGTDIANQKPTLPIIHCLENSNAEQKSELQGILVSRASTASDVLPHLMRTESIDYARSVAQNQARHATEFAESLSPSDYSKSLLELSKFVMDRAF